MENTLHELMSEDEIEEISGGNIDENYAFLLEIKKNNLADVPGKDCSIDSIKAAFKGNHKAAQRLKDILIGYSTAKLLCTSTRTKRTVTITTENRLP